MKKFTKIKKEEISQPLTNALNSGDKKPFIGLWDLERDGVTFSMLSTFLTCKEKMRLAYVEGFRLNKGGSSAMDFGTSTHEILDMVYTASRNYHPDKFLSATDDFISRATVSYQNSKLEDEILSADELQEFEVNLAVSEQLLRHYFKHWKRDFTKYEIVELEQVFDERIEIDGVSIRIRGKRDGVVRINGKLWLFETKTKARIDGSTIEDKLEFDLQVFIYFWSIWKLYGEFPAGVIYNVMKRPMLRQRKTATNPKKGKAKLPESTKEYAERCGQDVSANLEKYFFRVEGATSPGEIKKWMSKEFEPMLRDLLKWWNGGPHYKNTNSCTGGFFPCPMLRICGRNDTSVYRRRTTLFDELNSIPLKMG